MSLLSEELKTWGRIGVKRLISPRMMDWLRRSRRKANRKATREKQGATLAPLTRTQIEKDLQVLGVKRGHDLLVHSALSRIGPVEGGAETVIRALMAVIGPEATLIMPAYPMPASMYEWMSDPAPFCLKASPSRMGVLTEVFRKMPGVLRSSHPTHSVAALGPAAELYTRDHHKVLTPCAPGSPFRIHTDRCGDILSIGTGVGKITSYHVIEDYLDDYPLPVYLKQRMAKEVILADGTRYRAEIVVGNPRLSPWRVDNFKPKEIEFLGHLRGHMALREGRVGQAASHLIDGVRFHAMMLALTAKGITIYHLPRLGGRLAIKTPL
jgi:aminoglycoside 3-N-acetyltransferase